MSQTIVFIHGMFQNPKSWAGWISHFERLGYQCTAPAWPFHDGEPASLRAHPPAGLGDLGLAEITQSIEDAVALASESEQPILIGHSVGGLIVQLLVNRGLAKMGVCIAPVAPNRMLSFDWGFIKNSALIGNPLMGNEPFYTNLETFHSAFCNMMTPGETGAAFERTATHDSRNVLRDCLGPAGKVDLRLPHAPLLFIAGAEDAIIPADLVERNARAYSGSPGIIHFKLFPGRGHFICGEPGWQDVADYAEKWVRRQSPVLMTRNAA